MEELPARVRGSVLYSEFYLDAIQNAARSRSWFRVPAGAQLGSVDNRCTTRSRRRPLAAPRPNYLGSLVTGVVTIVTNAINEPVPTGQRDPPAVRRHRSGGRAARGQTRRDPPVASTTRRERAHRSSDQRAPRPIHPAGPPVPALPRPAARERGVRMPRRSAATKPRSGDRRRTRTLRRPTQLVRRRIPLVLRIHSPAQRRNDSVIAAIAGVIRDAMTADGAAETAAEEPERALA